MNPESEMPPPGGDTNHGATEAGKVIKVILGVALVALIGFVTAVALSEGWFAPTPAAESKRSSGPPFNPPAASVAPTLKRKHLVKKRDYDDQWAFTVPEGVLECKGDLPLFTAGGKTYGLDKDARLLGYPAIDPIWRDSPKKKRAAEPKVSLALWVYLAKELCKRNLNEAGTVDTGPHIPTTTASRTDRPAPSTTGRRISGDNQIGCTSREYRDKLLRYAIDKDEQAFSAALLDGVVAGVCTIFKSGEPVVLTDTAIFSGLVEVRRNGETAEYWVATEAVNQ